jgi:hypothetical protein
VKKQRELTHVDLHWFGFPRDPHQFGSPADRRPCDSPLESMDTIAKVESGDTIVECASKHPRCRNHKERDESGDDGRLRIDTHVAARKVKGSLLQQIMRGRDGRLTGVGFRAVERSRAMEVASVCFRCGVGERSGAAPSSHAERRVSAFKARRNCGHVATTGWRAGGDSSCVSAGAESH